MKTILLAATAALAFAGHAQAQRQSGLTGQSLAKLCDEAGTRQSCEAYIDGVADGAYFYQVLRPADGSKGAKLPGYICIPPTTTGVQLREKVVAFIEKKPDQASRAASGVVLRALDESYRCTSTAAAPKP